jgi:hypothetical protein
MLTMKEINTMPKLYRRHHNLFLKFYYQRLPDIIKSQKLKTESEASNTANIGIKGGKSSKKR